MAAWLTLYEAALDVIAEAERLMGGPLDWTIGGGTMLYRAFGHRQSKDIDVFVTDPQVLGFLSPRLNDAAARYVEGREANYVEQSNFVKLVLPAGEVDFIVAPRLTRPPAVPEIVGSRSAMVETPVEILAKKVFYRAAEFTARDVFDLAFLIEAGQAEGLMREPGMYLPKLEVILTRVETGRTALERTFRVTAPPTGPGRGRASPGSGVPADLSLDPGEGFRDESRMKSVELCRFA